MLCAFSGSSLRSHINCLCAIANKGDIAALCALICKTIVKRNFGILRHHNGDILTCRVGNSFVHIFLSSGNHTSSLNNRIPNITVFLCFRNYGIAFRSIGSSFVFRVSRRIKVYKCSAFDGDSSSSVFICGVNTIDHIFCILRNRGFAGRSHIKETTVDFKATFLNLNCSHSPIIVATVDYNLTAIYIYTVNLLAASLTVDLTVSIYCQNSICNSHEKRRNLSKVSRFIVLNTDLLTCKID